LHFEPGFRLMYASIGLTAEHFRASYFKALLKAVNDYDRQILLRPGVESAFCEASAECFAQGSEGLVRDSELLYRHWSFNVGRIERRVHMWQGLADTLVPAVINKEVADRMPGSVWHPVDGAGHFVAIGSADEVLARLGVDDPLLEIAKRLEEVALADPYFIERKLYPNVDFYSGVLYRAMGIPTNMFTVMFALGRLPGWIAHWLEQRNTPGARITRPRQIYTGETARPWVALDER